MLDIEFNSLNNFSKIKRFIQNKSVTFTGLTSFLRLVLLQKIQEVSGKKIIFVTPNEQSALRYQSDYRRLFDYEPQLFPFQNISMYETISHNLYDYAKQLDIFDSQPKIVITPVRACMEKFACREFFTSFSVNIKIGDEIDTVTFAQKLVNLGYKRSTMVSDIGEFSIRGDIIDVFSLAENPLRIELWGDEVVDLRLFNNQNQKSIEKIKEFSIKPIYKFLLGENSENSAYDNIPEKLKEALFLSADDGLSNHPCFFEGIEVYQSYFNSEMVSIFDYFNDYIIVFDESGEVYSKYEFLDNSFTNQMLESQKLEFLPELKSLNHFSKAEFSKQIAKFRRISLNNFIDFDTEDIIEFDSQPLKDKFSNFEDLSEYIIKQSGEFGRNVVIATDYKERIKELFKQKAFFDFQLVDDISTPGCLISDLNLILLTDRELFNKRPKEITAAKRSYYKEQQEFIESINDIHEGEFVVHQVHGVGIYKGLSQQDIDGQLKDYLTIEYAGTAKLHMPAEQVNMLCRYRGSGTVKPKLSKMGGQDWHNVKTRVKKEVEKVAYDLLRLYAKRKMVSGIAFDSDTPWQVEMEEAFEYVETPDQMKAIIDVKSDMESDTPMDRLICGDVGFGKTEVAIRAVFKAIASGKQVAVIVPTTILAMQHFQTIYERFKPFGISVQLMSRFRSQSQQKQTIKELISGECDVVVATHRILQDDVMFKNLGLVVIDEEHRFGVRHKEKLKSFKENVDIISMSATPIPRTLYMSLSGIKDMSVINTPPQNRLPVKTFVGEFNENALKNAVIHELDRDGQVFYLYNRVETIEQFRLKLQNLIPNAKIAVGHAQLDEKKLEQVMLDFANREFDILLSTTIIESGLDIPNANTIIIHDSDKFGLAQLYQLRGRVGRSDRQAYCYCFYAHGKNLTKEAVQRLKAIKEFTTLGSGYQIALRDVEIRGVGNLLGTKQHGHMINVGFDTYCQLLEETVMELKGENIERVSPTIVDINVTAFIPDEWVGSKEQKMIEYKRLADVKSEIELDYIVDEWKDRFSAPSQPVLNLINLIKIRLAATACKISLIRETPQQIRIYSPLTSPEWKIILEKLQLSVREDPTNKSLSVLLRNITKYIKFTNAPKSCIEGNSILLFNHSHLSFDEIFNILTDLFYYINKVTIEYTS